MQCCLGPDPVVQPAAKTVIGDGGASWRLRALKRAQQSAKEEGKNVAEVCTGHVIYLSRQCCP